MSGKLARLSVVCASVLYAAPTVAAELNAEEAKRFIAGKHFAYTCFEGTTGAGRIFSDGSVAGSIQIRGNGPVRYVVLPAGTLRIKGESYCATVRGLPFEPCFNVDKTSHQGFRGSIWGFPFAFCDFTRRSARVDLAATPLRLNTFAPGGGQAQRSAQAGEH